MRKWTLGFCLTASWKLEFVFMKHTRSRMEQGWNICTDSLKPCQHNECHEGSWDPEVAGDGTSY